MKVRFLLTALILLSAQYRAIALIDSVIQISSSNVPKYTKFEIGTKASLLTPDNGVNPYDGGEVDMYAIFTSPTGKQYRRDAFWYVPYQRCDTCTNNVERSCGWKDTTEYMNPADPKVFMKPATTNFPWRVRFAPPETGNWSYKVYVTSIAGDDSSASYSFTVSSSTEKGYIGTDTLTSSRYFKYKDNGEVFLPLGLNCIRVGASQEQDTVYNRIIMEVVADMERQMSAYGGNFLRIMMVPENFEIEWTDQQATSPLGNYQVRQPRMWDLDSVLALAEAHGVYIQLDISTWNDVDSAHRWARSPYNIYNDNSASGGHIFFTSSLLRNAFKNKLRYIMARWGYSPHLFAYELLQEIDLSHAYWNIKDDVFNWYEDMIQFMKTKDTTHLFGVSTGFSYVSMSDVNSQGRTLAQIPGVNFINLHHYGGDYNLEHQRSYMSRMSMATHPKKPMMFGELG